MRRAGGGTTWTSGGAGGGRSRRAKQKGGNDGVVRVRTTGCATIIDVRSTPGGCSVSVPRSDDTDLD